MGTNNDFGSEETSSTRYGLRVVDIPPESHSEADEDETTTATNTSKWMPNIRIQNRIRRQSCTEV